MKHAGFPMNFTSNVYRRSPIDDCKEIHNFHLPPGNSQEFRMSTFCWRFSLELQTLRVKSVSKTMPQIFPSICSCGSFRQTTCLEIIYLQNLGGEKPATLYNSLSRFWLSLHQPVLNSGCALHLAIHMIKQFSTERKAIQLGIPVHIYLWENQMDPTSCQSLIAKLSHFTQMSIQSASEWKEGTGRRAPEEARLLTGLFSKWLPFLGEVLGCSTWLERRSS